MSPEAERPPSRRNLDLLTRVEYRDASGAAQRCFGNILELGTRSVRLEAGRELRVAQRVVLHVVFPGQRHHPDPVVALPCVVRKAHDALCYDLAFSALESGARERVRAYLKRSSRPRPEEGAA